MTYLSPDTSALI